MAQRRTAQNRTASRGKTGREVELYPVSGNTVRKAQPLETEEEIRRRRVQEEEDARAGRAARRAQRNRIREQRMNRVYVAFLSVCVCMVFGICFLYIQLQSEATQYKNSIASVQSEVNDLQADNEESLQNIETSVDLSEIRQRAMDELGMTYPSADQIVTYDADASDTLTQYAGTSSSDTLLSGIFGD